MATIGTFKKIGNGYTGDITTLSVQAKGVRIAAEENRSNDNAPTHRVFVGKAEIGAAWTKRSNEAGTTSRSSWTTRASPPRSTPTCSRTATPQTPTA